MKNQSFFRELFVLASALVVSACDPGAIPCPAGQSRISNVCTETAEVRLNSVGFLPDRSKRATVPLATGGSFIVRRAADDASAFEAALSSVVVDGSTGEAVSIADFTALSEAGSFYLDVPGAGRSPVFRIADDVFDAALHDAMLGLTGQRCGMGVSFQHAGKTFSHEACHEKDARLDYQDGSDVVRPSVGGWHDAGDYGKYTVNAAFSVAFLLQAFSHFEATLGARSFDVPEHGGALPDFLTEPKWELEWLRTVVFPDGRASHKVTATNFEGLEVMPEGDASPRFYAPTGTAATADVAAVMALAARIYGPHDAAFAASCLDLAKLSYGYLVAHPGNEAPDLSAFSTGGYGTDDTDDRIWAAAELWESTGDAAALADFESRAAGRLTSAIWDWGDTTNLGLFTYLLSTRDGRDPALVEALRASAIKVGMDLADESDRHAHGRGIGDSYFWGIHGVVVRSTMNLEVAYRLSQNEALRDASVRQLDHVFGRNVDGRSQVTGIGHAPPQSPHHRPSIAGGSGPFPGLLVGGPWPLASSWVDDAEAYETNEVAINWNAALVYALAANVR